MRSTWWTRYIHIHRVSKGVCPCCENKGEYSMCEFPHHFWLYFQCKSCGYELREHVRREKEEGTMPEEKRVLLMLNDIDEGAESIGHISVPENKVEEFQKVLRYRDIGTMRVSVEELNSVEELSCYLNPDDERCHHGSNKKMCPDCTSMPEDAEER